MVGSFTYCDGLGDRSRSSKIGRRRSIHPYGLPPNSTVDGVIEEAEATGVATSVLHARSAFGVFTASDAANVARYTAEKDRKYREAVQAAGDAFFTERDVELVEARSRTRGMQVPLRKRSDRHDHVLCDMSTAFNRMPFC